ncbi:50S ribosome-binding GTPase [Georgenia sp. TF02-10]|uniref:GTPase n=1 Tax=Georgenia sp. TF02-10 TaxID=2917725 RepID=UPI001FA7900D|nr:GTPase [Georgenia sp. TF02-10]UNX53266.1 50S ribosome-binding GTPase [Georgenia sp. TF02-10]
MRRQRRHADAAAALPADLAALREAVDLGAAHLPAGPVEATEALLARAERRQNLAAGRTVVALLGATGSGKSSLFNALVGRDVARVAARRPTTSRPLAAVWGADDAADLLDWLGVAERTQVPAGSGPPADGRAGGGRAGGNDRAGGNGRPGRAGDGANGRGGGAGAGGTGAADPAGLVLLDLPDIDSTAVDHRRTAARLAGAVDVLVWVLDPQKYADAIVHRDYLAPMAAHAEVTLVVLNQVDTLDRADLDRVLADLAGLLARDGLAGVDVLPVSAREGTGVDALRAQITAVVATTRAAQQRLAADVRTAAAQLARVAEVDGDPPPETVGERPVARLVDAAAQAAGVDAVHDAARGSYLRAARRHVGWPPVRWLGRLRPDPLRRLHLGDRAADAGLARTSLPGPTPVQEAAVRAAAHALAATATTRLPESWRADVLQDVEARVPPLVDALDQQIAGTELEQDRRPAWWRFLGVLQWLFLAAAVVGGGWLLALAGLDYLRLPPPRTPELGPLPWPTVLLGGGVAGGLLLALVGGLAARVGARRRARRVARRLREVVAATVQAQVVDPLQAQLAEYARFVRALRALSG